jgi:hypothetical protein
MVGCAPTYLGISGNETVYRVAKEAAVFNDSAEHREPRSKQRPRAERGDGPSLISSSRIPGTRHSAISLDDTTPRLPRASHSKPTKPPRLQSKRRSPEILG